MTELLFINKVPGDRSAFSEKVKSISKKLGINPNWLMFLINFESMGTFRASIENSYGCIGLIQFCPNESGGTYKTINGRPYSMEEIKSMSNVEQLDLVYEYLYEKQGIGRKLYTFYDLYLAILWPKAVGKEDDYVINTSTNPIFDIAPKDGIITIGEIKRFLDERVAKEVPVTYQREFKKKVLFSACITERLSLAA